MACCVKVFVINYLPGMGNSGKHFA
ncbi:MAG: hypothetical protein RIR52_1894, partial [Acidobacteriota bacterium]